MDSPTHRLIEWLLIDHAAVTCSYALEEVRRNVLLKRPAQAEALAMLMTKIQLVPDTQFPLPVDLVEKDRPSVGAAIRAGSTHLATGDKRDFGHLYDRTVEGVTVVSLLRLAEILTGA